VEAERPPERIVHFRPRTVLTVVLVLLGVAAALEVVYVARGVLTWILVAVFLTLALNPAVEWFQRHGLRNRGAAVGLTFIGVLAGIALLGATFIPTLVAQVRDFVDQIPGYVEDLTKEQGRLGFLEREYHIVERVKEAVQQGGPAKILGISGTALAVTKGVITGVIATLTIAFLTFFMLLEGPVWMERFYSLLPAESQPRWRAVGRDIYRTVGGYVTGNLLISLIAGITSTIVLLIMGVPFAVALGLLVALLDLIPLAGATIAAILVGTVSFLHSVPAGIVVVVFFLVYQQLENHVLQPLIYGRTVQLSPLPVLIAVLIGAELAGVLGALGAIPIAGSIQVVVRDLLAQRRAAITAGVAPET
jgi:predicted PurR-regulated permease PerM